MCECLSFLTTHPDVHQRWSGWRRSLVRMYLRVRSWSLLFPAVEVEVFRASRIQSPASSDSASSQRRRDGLPRKGLSKPRRVGACVSADGTIYILETKQEKPRDPITISTRKPVKLRKKEVKKLLSVMSGVHIHEKQLRFAANGGSDIASLFTRQGLKGINQDAMLVLENFASRLDTVFCGVFDGHGPEGHLVARSVRDMLPEKLASCWQTLRCDGKETALLDGLSQMGKPTGDPHLITAWKESFLNAYKLMDRELLVDDNVDCVSSGTTAVTLVKQANDLFIGNVGDSRAVLGTRSDDGSLMALQLTVDLKPNLPKEAERIRRLKGRVFALRNEPSVKRVWLPHHNAPGLAMARALGDYCLKNFGVISEPQVTYRRLTEKDKFIVLATDGVWDVLSNEQVVEIVASAPAKSFAAKAVVDTAVKVWRSRYSTSKVDDCAVVCLFLDNFTTASSASVSKRTKEASLRKRRSAYAVSPSRRQIISEERSVAHSGGKVLSTSSQTVITAITTDEKGNKKRKIIPQPTRMAKEEREWSAVEGVARANTFINLPRYARQTGA